VVAIIIAIIVTIFSFGSAGSAAVIVAAAIIAGITNSVAKAVDSVCGLMLVAEQLRHPLAARFAAAVSQISKALQNVTRNNRYDTVAADAALREILQALRTIEGLGRESAQVIGPCTGDPDAVYQCGRQLSPLLARLAEILQTMRLLSADQQQAAIRALQTANLVLTRPRIS
jgi:hypothetical protein